MVFAQYSHITGVPATCREQVLRAHTFLGLNGLVNTVAPSAAFHDATRESVDNRNFIPLHKPVRNQNVLRSLALRKKSWVIC